MERGTPRGSRPGPGVGGTPKGARYTRREFLARAAAGAMAASVVGGRPAVLAGPRRPTPTSDFDAEIATGWFARSLSLVRQSPGFSPPVASRAFAYAGIALYEALLPGMPGYRTLAGRLADLGELPSAGRNAAYHWPSVANATLASILRDLFPATQENGEAISELEERFEAEFGPGVPPGVRERSTERGRAVAGAIFEWSIGDGGHAGYLRNFPPEYAPPSGPGLWVPTPPAFLPALQPSWGRNRTFALGTGAGCPAEDHPPYAGAPGSRFHDDAVEVYETVNRLTPEQRAIASFWADDPGQTATPAGHSISILTQALRALDASLDRAAEAYARLGMAVADAFICCWDVKFRYNLLRPVTYVRALIDPSWTPPLVTPPFPEYTSGHSVQSAAVAHVMTDLFGDVPFIDHTHDARGLEPRSFGTFGEAAEEAAISRLYGGIHFRPAIENGLAQGRCVGEAVAALKLVG